MPALYGDLFLRRFEEHIGDFIQKLGRPKSGNIYIGLSGGADSVCLLKVINNLWQSHGWPKPIAIHCDHSYREESAQDLKWIESLCKELQIELISFKREESHLESNIEALLRDWRYSCFEQVLEAQDNLLLGHHIDDSFEWSLSQQFKTSSTQGLLGIPVIRGSVCRPLMSVTKAQIFRYLEISKQSFIEDWTNNDERFERNALRAKITKPLQKNYPNLLKHYVRRSNDLARRLELSAFKKEVIPNVEVYKDCFEQYYLFDRKLHALNEHSKNIVQDLITKLSDKGRGKVSKQLNELILGIKKKKDSGPWAFSGNVDAYIRSGQVILRSKMKTNNLKKLNELSKTEVSAYQILENGLSNENYCFPGSPFYLVSPDNLEKKGWGKSQSAVDPLYPNEINTWKKQKYWYRSLGDILIYLKKQRNLPKKGRFFVWN